MRRAWALRMPREGGIYSIWVAALAYAAPLLWSRGLGTPACLALLGSAAILPASEHARVGSRTARILATLSVAAPYAAVAASRLPGAAVVALAGLLLYYASLRLDPSLRPVVGGGLIAFHGSMLALSLGVDPLRSLVPVPYAVLGAAEASVRVSGPRASTRALETCCGALLAVYALLALGPASLQGAAVTADLLARLAMWGSGLARRLSLKAYGVLEFARLTTVLLVLGLGP
ncbi:MAG: hypothetical protein QI199_04570 [Candidatus Korarchaeota archaeon]|nr:hypothetical protein [Candidatus Korarchaeota archaeon]